LLGRDDVAVIKTGLRFYKETDMTLNLAHRGARSLAPENTLAAARKALEIGADLWETDVTVTRDGTLILMHDDTLVRTTDAAQRFPDRAPWTVSTFSISEIKTLDAGTWFVETDPFGQIAAGQVRSEEARGFRRAKVPTLEEALLFTQQNGWRVNLELKPLAPPMDRFDVVPRVLALMENLAIDPNRVIISSFYHPWLHAVARRAALPAVQALVGWDDREALDGRDLAFQVYNLSRSLADTDRIARLLGLGKQINVYTVNEESEMRALIAAGVHGLFTDFPQRLARVLKSGK